MSWVPMALSAAAVMGIVSILDKAVLVRYIRSPLTLPLLLGLVHGSIGVIVTLALPWLGESPLSSVGWALLSGIIAATGGTIFLRVLYSQEVSRALPVWNTFPIFATLIAFIFLDERLSLYHWIAIMITVTGAVLLSVRQGQEYRGLFLHRSFYALIAASVLQASAHVIGKVALDDLPVINTYGIRGLGIGFVLLLGNLRPVSVREVRNLLYQRSPALAIIGLSVALVNGTRLMTLWALSLGPVSLVTTLLGTHSLFVLLFSTGLAWQFRGLLREEVSVGTVAIKVVSTALIVGGVATITLN